MKQQRHQQNHQVQQGNQGDVPPADKADVSEQIAEQLHLIARRVGDQDHARGHAHRPERADQRVQAFAGEVLDRADQQRGQQGRRRRPVQRIKPVKRWIKAIAQKNGRAHAADRDMRDRAAEENNSPCHDVRADDAAGQAGQQPGQQPGAQKRIDRQIAEEINHGFSPA